MMETAIERKIRKERCVKILDGIIRDDPHDLRRFFWVQCSSGITRALTLRRTYRILKFQRGTAYDVTEYVAGILKGGRLDKHGNLMAIGSIEEMTEMICQESGIKLFGDVPRK